MDVVLLHPDLGIGGAERLTVDIALSLKSRGHRVHIVTCHHDKSHCFAETVNGTFDVTVVGDFLPRSIVGRFHAACSYLRMIYAAVFILLAKDLHPSVIFCDQVSVCIPVLKLMKVKIIFYCHFPDQLLTERTNLLKWLYRVPLDWLEEKTTGMADVVLVNSKFTRSVFYKTFQSLKHIKVKVLYPTICEVPVHTPHSKEVWKKSETTFLSINRYERKKNVQLAVHALGELKTMLPQEELHLVHLIIAGGYDERIVENKEYFQELSQVVKHNNMLDKVTFLKSPSDSEKYVLFNECSAVLYTPSNEHFGIVPLEAMFFSKPVIACNSGGPLETVVDGETGFLCEPTAKDFAAKMKLFVLDKSLSQKLGRAGAEHVMKYFSANAFTENLEKVLNSV